VHPAGLYSTRVVTGSEEREAIADDWGRCWVAHPRRQVQQHLDALLYDNPDRDGRPSVQAVVLEADAQIVGIAPFIITPLDVTWRIRLPRRWCTVLRFRVSAVEVAGEEFIGRLDIAAQRTLLEGLLDACREVDVVRFPYTRIALDSDVKSTTRQHAHRWFRGLTRETPVLAVQLSEDFSTYRQAMKKKRRDNFRREARILDEVNGSSLRLRVVTDPAEVPGFLDLADRVFAESWHASRGATKLRKGDRSEERFVWLAAHGWLRCYVLLKDEEPIAFVSGLQCGRRFQAVRTAYSMAWARYSPGKVLWYRVLEDLHESGAFDELNFGYGEWEYKRVMANDSYSVRTVDAIRPGIRNALIWSGPVAYGWLRATLIAALSRHRLDHRITRWSRRHLAR